MALDQLVELPEWLTGDVAAEADVRSVRSQITMAENSDSPSLSCEVELRVRALANTTDAPEVLRDIYATQGSALDVETRDIRLCARVERANMAEAVRGTVLVGEGAPRVGTVIATQIRPVIGSRPADNGAGRLEGVLEVCVLYVSADGEPAGASAELPFAINVPMALNEYSSMVLQVLSAESGALMGDRLDVKAQLSLRCENRVRETARIVTNVTEGAPLSRRPGIVIVWPEEGEDAWTIARRYAIPAEQAADAQTGRALVLKL